MTFVVSSTVRRDIRSHTFSNEEWKEEELEAIFDMHERLTDLAMLFCFVPRAKYLPLGPIRSAARCWYTVLYCSMHTALF